MDQPGVADPLIAIVVSKRLLRPFQFNNKKRVSIRVYDEIIQSPALCIPGATLHYHSATEPQREGALGTDLIGLNAKRAEIRNDNSNVNVRFGLKFWVGWTGHNRQE